MSLITDVQPIEVEIVLTERTVSTDFRIVEVQESIQNRSVRADIELGPFVANDGPGGPNGPGNELRGSSRRSIGVWQNEEYDAIRDTWTNATLLAKIKTLLEAQV